MGKRSRERKRLAKGMVKEGQINNGQPIVGDMATRMTILVRGDTQTPDQRRLPIHYGGVASSSSSGAAGGVDSRVAEGWVYGKYNSWDHKTKRWVQGRWESGRFIQDDESLTGHTDSVNVYDGRHLRGYKSEAILDAGFRRTPPDETTFRCESEDITADCPIAKTPEVYLPALMWNELVKLAKDCDTEWLAYLCGSFDAATRRFNVDKLYFPPQTATGAHVDVDEDFEPKPGTIGAIHSHVNMQVFFSGEDIAHSNWAVEIVINSREEYKVMVRHKLECGKFAKGYSKVFLVGASASAVYGNALDKAFKAGEAADVARRRKDRRVSGFVPISEHDLPQAPASNGASNGNGNPELSQPSIIPGMAIDDQSGAVVDMRSEYDRNRDSDKAAETAEDKKLDALTVQSEQSDVLGSDEFEGETCVRCAGQGMIFDGAAGFASDCPNCDGTGVMLKVIVDGSEHII